MQSELRSGRRGCLSPAHLLRRGGGDLHCPETARKAEPSVDFFCGIRAADAYTSTPIAPKVVSRKPGCDAASDSGFYELCPGSSSSAATAADSPYAGEYSRRDACLSQSLSGDDAVALSSCEFETSHGIIEVSAGPVHDVDVSSAVAMSLDASLNQCPGDGRLCDERPLQSLASYPAAASPSPRDSSVRTACDVDADGSAVGVVIEPASVPLMNFSQKLKRFLKDADPKKVIGRRVGLDHVDIVTELASMGIPCLAWIASYLGPSDVRRCCMVSHTWQSAFRRYLPTALKGTPSNKENAAAGGLKKSNPSAAQGSGRGSPQAALSRPCLATVQPTVQSQQQTPALAPTPSAGGLPSLHQRFAEEAKNLRCGEKLSRCPRCRHPARLNEAAERGTCTRLGCSFDYCTHCFSDYHGPKACLPQLKRTRHEAIGSKRSKRNLRRL